MIDDAITSSKAPSERRERGEREARERLDWRDEMRSRERARARAPAAPSLNERASPTGSNKQIKFHSLKNSSFRLINLRY